MNIRSEIHSNGGTIPSFRNLKLSPDSVCESVALGVGDKMQPIKRENRNALAMIPDLKTPGLAPTNERVSQPNSKPPLQPHLVRQSPQKPSDQLPSVLETEPKIPPRSPITKARPRSISESEASCASRRRAIFGQYWNQGGNNTVVGGERSLSPRGSNHRPSSKDTASLNITETPPPPNRVRKRSSSMTIIDGAGMLPGPMDYRMFAPPKEHADRSSICGRFASVEDVPPNTMLDSLPPLPSPLRRFCTEGDAPGCLNGMYPLMTPIPVLRQSSYRSLFGDKGNGDPKTKRPSWFGNDGQGSFNLTESWRPDRAVSFDAVSTSSSEGSSSNANKASVRFDPRVTVTEFEDPVERVWYNDEELDRLKYDTILLAQEYLLTHPDKAERYNRAILDPVTGTYRKKALFSLPILSSAEEERIPSPDHKEYEALINSQVKTILIVDPNKAILDLFCKSMHSMFPNARLFKTPSGDEALQLVASNLKRRTSSPCSFDIIIVEQRLFQLANVGNDKARSLVTMSERGGTLPFLGIHKLGSFSGGAHCTGSGGEVCGSDLIKVIQRLEDEAFAEKPSDWLPSPTASAKNTEVSVTCSKPIQRRSLLIGVSMQPDRDAKDFQQAGADVVWGKPIPSVGDALRNQLLHVLVEKRRRSITCGQPEIEEEAT